MKKALNIIWRFVPRIFSALGIFAAILILVFEEDKIFFTQEWMKFGIPIILAAIAFAILILVSWDESKEEELEASSEKIINNSDNLMA